MKITSLIIGAMLIQTSAVALCQTPGPEAVTTQPKILDLIRDAVKLHIAAGELTGSIVQVSRNGKTIFVDAQGAGSDPAKTMMRADGIFALASMTKPFTTTAILMLADEGKLKLDDPVSKYIPEFGRPRQVRVLQPGSPPAPFTPLPFIIPPEAREQKPIYQLVSAKRPITVRDLLTHTSGIQIFGIAQDLPAIPESTPNTLAARVPRYASAPLEFQPGSRWAYSNGPGFETLGRIIEVASGQPFNVFLKQRLFQPLGLADTDFGVHRADLARAMPPPIGNRIAVAEEATYFSGDSGLWSTVADYSRFAQMLLNEGTLDGRRYLNAETVKMMTSNQIGDLEIRGYPPVGMPTEGLRFGFSVTIVNQPVGSGLQLPQGSFGWDGVGTRRFWVIPKLQTTIVMMTPGIGPVAAPLQRDIEGLTLAAIKAAP